MSAATSGWGAISARLAVLSARRMFASEIKHGEIGRECRFVFEAAQVEDVRAVLDASDHRNGKLAQRSRDAVRDVGCSAFSDIGASHLS
jgi:hypothetical protein